MPASPDRKRIKAVAARMARIERLLAEGSTARAGRLLTEAADTVLAMAGPGERGADWAAVLAETLMRKASVQDLLTNEARGPVDIGDRLGSLAMGLVYGDSRLTEVRTTAPSTRVSARSARWITALAAEVLESFAVGPPASRADVALVVNFDSDLITMVATGGSAPGSGSTPHIDRARMLAVAMGGRLREEWRGGGRVVAVALPSRFVRSAA